MAEATKYYPPGQSELKQASAPKGKQPPPTKRQRLSMSKDKESLSSENSPE